MDPNAPGPFSGPAVLRAVLSKRIRMQGFIVSDFFDKENEALFNADMPGWVASGKIKYREDVTEGFEKTPETFLRLFKGENFGKLLVKV
jgi:NADPH-dependent curcumin reductase CurA